MHIQVEPLQNMLTTQKIINTELFPALFPLDSTPAGFFQLIFTPAHVNWHFPFLSHCISCGSSSSTTSNFSDLCPGSLLQWVKSGINTKPRLGVRGTMEDETKRRERLGTELFPRPKDLCFYIKSSHLQGSAVLWPHSVLVLISAATPEEKTHFCVLKGPCRMDKKWFSKGCGAQELQK